MLEKIHGSIQTLKWQTSNEATGNSWWQSYLADIFFFLKWI